MAATTDAGASGYKKSTAREYFESICIAVILALFVRTFVVQAFKIPTGSMEPNLLIGDHLLVNKFVFGPHLSGVESALLPMDDIERREVIRCCAPRVSCSPTPSTFGNHAVRLAASQPATSAVPAPVSNCTRRRRVSSNRRSMRIA